MKTIGSLKKIRDKTFEYVGHVNGELVCVFVTKKKDKTEIWDIKRPESESETLMVLESL
jgi:hypothetical protein